MIGTLKCKLCGDDAVPEDGIEEHFATYHSSANLARWPDGQLVIVNEDDYEAP